jgi:diguanylate cyclase (GGDEF)-like protein
MREQLLLLITNILLGISINVCLMIAARDYPLNLKRSLYVWAQAGLWVTSCWIILSLRRWLGDYASTASFALLGYACGEYVRAVRLFQGKKASILHSRYCALMFLATGVGLNIGGSPSMRIAAASILTSLLMLLVAYEAWAARRIVANSSTLTALFAVALALIQGVRSIYIFYVSPDEIVTNLGLQVVIAASTALFSLLAVSFSLMCNERLSAELGRALRFDGLTGVLNRAPWRSELDEVVRTPHAFSVVLFDLDNFKHVNDEFGHAAGDYSLSAVSACARGLFGDSVGRLGGEEFAVILPDIDSVTAMALAERFRLAVSRLNVVSEGRPVPLTVSVGVCTREGNETAAQLLKAADDAMYQAKRAGRDRCQRASASG